MNNNKYIKYVKYDNNKGTWICNRYGKITYHKTYLQVHNCLDKYDGYAIKLANIAIAVLAVLVGTLVIDTVLK